MNKRILKSIKIMMKSCMVLSILLCGVLTGAAENEDSQSYLLYENDFESYEGGSFCSDDSRWVATYASNSTKYVDENGNVWMKMKADKYTAYDFAIAEDANEGLTTGKILFSFDAQRAKSDCTINSYLRYVTTANANMNFIFIESGTNNVYLEGNKSKVFQMQDDVPAKIDIVIDLDNDIFTLATNGEIISTYSYGINGELKSMRFAPTDELMVDNLKIAYTQEETFDFKVETIEISDNVMKIEFNQTVSAVADIKDIRLRNLYTGETVKIDTAEVKNSDEIYLVAEDELDRMDEYLIEFPESLKSAFGDELTNCTHIIESKGTDDGFALTKVLLYDYEEMCYNLSDELPAVLKRIELNFSNPVERETIKDKISILSANQENIQSIPSITQIDEKKVIVSFEGTLCENEDYILKIDNIFNNMGDKIKKGYSIPFSVGKGELTVTDYGFYKDDVLIGADEILPGDVLKAKFTLLKPQRSEKDIFVSYGIYEGNFMTRFKSEKITIGVDETKASGELEVKIPEVESFTLKSFLWGSSNGFPITKKIELKR